MSAPSENMPIAMSAARARPLLLRHLPYFIGAAMLVAFLVFRPQGIFGERVAEKA